MTEFIGSKVMQTFKKEWQGLSVDAGLSLFSFNLLLEDGITWASERSW